MDLWFNTKYSNFKEEKTEMLANTQLISAAPDLLKACMLLLDNAEIDSLNESEGMNPDLHEGIKLAKQAINKALGL